jgi:hypothetical protein
VIFLLPKLLVLSTFVRALFYHNLTVCGPAISPGQKWWQTFLKRKVSWSQWESSACTDEGFAFFLWGERGGGGVDRVSPIDPPWASPPHPKRGASIGECPMFQINWWCANHYASFHQKKKKKRFCAPMNKLICIPIFSRFSLVFL